MKYYVVSDIHSYYTELEVALREKGYFEDKEPHKLIICGDIFDRGDESRKVENFVYDLISKDEVILIRGNHEDLMLELLNNADRWFKIPTIRNSHHWHNGTVKSVMDLTGLNYSDLDNPTNVVNKMNKTKMLTDIIPKMVNYYETEHYIFVHGWIPCLRLKKFNYLLSYYYDDWRKASEKDWELARFDNGMQQWSNMIIEPNKTIVCGHWNTSWGHCYLDDKCSEFGTDADFTPYKKSGIIAIDACVGYTRKINCIVIED